MLATRDQQLVWKRVQAEQELRLKQAENEMIQIAIDMNKKLDDETNRLKVEASKQYGEDLKSQIEYNKELTVCFYTRFLFFALIALFFS